MSRKARVLVGFGGIIVCIFVGAISVAGDFEPGQILSTIGGILFFTGAYRAVFSGKPLMGGEEAIVDRNRREQELDRRLADIQEIVISIDDRLRRLEAGREQEETHP